MIYNDSWEFKCFLQLLQSMQNNAYVNSTKHAHNALFVCFVYTALLCKLACKITHFCSYNARGTYSYKYNNLLE